MCLTKLYMQMFIKCVEIFLHKSKISFHNLIDYFSISMFFFYKTSVSVCGAPVNGVSELNINVLKRVLNNVLKYILST